MGEEILVSEKGRICEIVMNRPDRYNALSNDLMDSLHQALISFKGNPNCHVAILRGAGVNFSSGADIKQFGDAEAQTSNAIKRRANASMEVHRLFAAIEKPIICSVQGYALAGGCGLAMAGDLVIASENAIFGYPEIKRGFVPALVLTNLSKLVGRRKALEMLLTGRKVSAQEALACGMVNEIVPDDQLESKTWELASDLAALNPDSLAHIKGLYYRVVDMDFSKAIECGRDINVLMRQTKEFSQGVADFQKKPY